MTNTLPLTPVVDVTYTLSPRAAAKASFGIGAILGPSRVFNKTNRGAIFNSVDEMLEYGFTNNDPEVAAAQIYFAASSKPKKLYVGAYVNYNVEPSEGTKTTEVYNGAWSNGNNIRLNDEEYTIGGGSSGTTSMADIKEAAEALGASFEYLENTKTVCEYDGPFNLANIVMIDSTAYIYGDGEGTTSTMETILQAALTAGCETATYDEENHTLVLRYENMNIGDLDPALTLEVSKGEGSDVGEMEITRGTLATLEYSFSNAEVGELPLTLQFDIFQGSGSPVGTPSTTMGTNPVPEVTEETPVEALQANRAFNTEWYAAAFTMELSKEQTLALALSTESAANVSTLFIICGADDVLNGVEGNMFEALKAGKYCRTIGFASKKNYTHIGAMAYAMGQTKDTAGSSYTLALKNLPGCTVDNFTSQQVSKVESYFGNVYINRGAAYDMTENGTCFSGDYYDEIIQLDKLANRIQTSVMDLLYSLPKVSQTEPGLSKITTKISQACEEAIRIGFIAGGTWTGPDILTLATGDTLPLGYVVLAESFEEQSTADREARKAPNIYVPIKLAGAIQSVVIEIPVNR